MVSEYCVLTGEHYFQISETRRTICQRYAVKGHRNVTHFHLLWEIKQGDRCTNLEATATRTCS